MKDVDPATRFLTVSHVIMHAGFSTDIRAKTLEVNEAFIHTFGKRSRLLQRPDESIS